MKMLKHKCEGNGSTKLDNILGIEYLEDTLSEKLFGGAFEATDALGDYIVPGSSGTFLIDEGSEFLGIRNTGPNAGDPNDVDHNFVVNFINNDNQIVARGNIQFGRGINSDVIDRALGLGGRRVFIDQREPTSDDEDCTCPRIL